MSHLYFGYAFVVISWGKRFLVGIIRGLVAFWSFSFVLCGVALHGESGLFLLEGL